MCLCMYEYVCDCGCVRVYKNVFVYCALENACWCVFEFLYESVYMYDYVIVYVSVCMCMIMCLWMYVIV